MIELMNRSKPLSTLFLCFLLVCFANSCSSQQDEQYEEYANFETQQGDFEGSEYQNQNSNQGQQQSATDNGYENQNEQYSQEQGQEEYANASEQSQEQGQGINNYENFITSDDSFGENLNNDTSDSELTDTVLQSENSGQYSSDTNAGLENEAVNQNVLGANPSQNLQGQSDNATLVESSEANYSEPSSIGYESPDLDVLPSYATLWWVGYNLDPENDKLTIEILTKGEPQYELFQERNQSSQPELVIRFFSTRMRSRISLDIDASEFKAPVAFVRMREDIVEGHVDVVLTLRDSVKPSFFAKDGNFLLTYDIPSRYLTPDPNSDAEYSVAELVGDEDVSPSIEQGSDLPKSQVQEQVDPVANMPSNVLNVAVGETQPYENIATVASNTASEIPAVDSMPENFNADAPVQGEIISNETPQDVANQTAVNEARSVQASDQPAARLVNPATPETNAAMSLPVPEISKPRVPVKKQPSYYQYQAPYRVPYQQRYAPAYQQAPVYRAPVPTQPYYQTPPTAVPGGQAPAGSESPEVDDGELDGSGFENDDSFQDFDTDGTGESGDDLEKFEVRSNQALEDLIVSHVMWHGASVAQYENFTSENLYGGYEEDVGTDVPANAEGGNNYSGGDYNYEADLAPVAEVNEIEGTGIQEPEENFSGKLITLEFFEASLPNVLKVFTEQTGINFVFPQAVAAGVRVTVKLRGVPWDAALKAILDSNNLAMSRITDTIIKIDRNANIANYLQQQNALATQQARSLATKTLVFRLSYAQAAQASGSVEALLRDPNGILPNAIVSPDERTNSLIIEGIPEILAKAKGIIQRLDTPTMQAEIASRIVEVSKLAGNFLGVAWGGGLNYDAGRGLGFGSLTFPNSITADYSVDALRDASTPGNLGFRFGSLNELVDLDLRLQMEEQMRNSRTLQSQKIIVQDGGSANISSGKSDFFRVTTVQAADGGGAAVAGGLQEVQSRVALTINNLQISNDDMVTLPMSIASNSAVPAPDGAAASQNVRQIETTLVSRTGETVVIGGVNSTSSTENEIGIPFFSSIPIIGALFRSKGKTNESSELLVMLTPTILNPERLGTGEIESLSPDASSSGANYNSGGGSNYGEEYENASNNAGEEYSNQNANQETNYENQQQGQEVSQDENYEPLPNSADQASGEENEYSQQQGENAYEEVAGQQGNEYQEQGNQQQADQEEYEQGQQYQENQQQSDQEYEQDQGY